MNPYHPEGENISSPYWKLKTSHLSDTSYSFTGYRSDDLNGGERIRFNYSRCDSSELTEYDGSILGPDSLDGYTRELNITSESRPTVNGRFDNRTASLEIRGVIDAYETRHGITNRSYIGGPVIISFSGNIDSARSDELLSSSNDTPIWNPTLGYSKTLFASSAPRNSVSRWLYLVGGVSYIAWFLSWAGLSV